MGGLLAACLAGLWACGDDPAPPSVPLTPLGPSSTLPAQDAPDVLLIVLDTTRADRCAFLDPAGSTVPQLARLAAESVVYTDAWSPAGWTGPAHASLFTGQRPPRHGFLGSHRWLLPAPAWTLAELLHEAGYRTACLANNPVISDSLGLTQGFEHAPRIRPETPRPYARDAHTRAFEYARDSRSLGRPSFVFVNDYEPHLPYDPPTAIAARHVTGDPDATTLDRARLWGPDDALRLALGGTSDLERVRPLLPQLYDAEVATLDEIVAEHLDRLRAEGLLDRTLVVITSDHGENLGDHGLWDHRFSMHRSICHVPLLVRYPGGAGGGTVVRDVVRLEDVFATVLDVTGVAPRDEMQGVSLRHDLPGRVSRGAYGPNTALLRKAREIVPLADETPLRTEFRTVFDGSHHLIATRDGGVQLFDVRTDPGEEHDLAQREPAIVERLRALLDTW